MVETEDPEYPAPPCRFRANRGRMTLNIRVTLHHIGAEQINLKTSKTKIELDTLASRRKFKLSGVHLADCWLWPTRGAQGEGDTIHSLEAEGLGFRGDEGGRIRHPSPPDTQHQ